MKVFVVTKEDYDNDSYNICGVADTMRQAQKLAEYFEDPDCIVDIGLYDTDDIQHLDDGKKRYRVCYTPVKKTYGVTPIEVTEAKPNGIDDLLNATEIAEGRSLYGDLLYAAYIPAKDEEHALKIFWNKFIEYSMNAMTKGGNKL